LEFVHGPQFNVKIGTHHLGDWWFNIVHFKLLHKTGTYGIHSLMPRLKMSGGSYTSIPPQKFMVYQEPTCLGIILAAKQLTHCLCMSLVMLSSNEWRLGGCYISKRKDRVGSSHLVNKYLIGENEESINSSSRHSLPWDEVTFVNKM